MIKLDINTEELKNVLTLCTSMHLAVLHLSLDGYILYANTISEALLLSSHQQLLGRSLHEVCQKIGIVLLVEDLSAPTSHYLPDGQAVDVHWSSCRHVEAGSCTGYILIGKLIKTFSTRHPMKDMKHIIQSIPGAIYSKDTQGLYITANDYLAHIAGFNHANELINRSDDDTAWSSVASTLRNADQACITEQTTIIVEEYPILADGKRVVMLSTKSPLKSEEGEVLGIVATSVNITQFKQTAFSQDTYGESFRLNPDETGIYLSKKEIECITWMIKGKSAAEIAIILHISQRTVEAHINNVKRKLNCYKQFQLGYLLGKYGYLLI